MSRFVYPRLARHIAEDHRARVESTYRRNGLEGLATIARTEDPDANPVRAGGLVASSTRIKEVRNEVLDAISPWLELGRVPKRGAGAFDIALGESLHRSLQIIPSDAAHPETWNFLTLVVLPDVAVLRYPDMHPNRLLGGPRNALRAAWIPRDTLGGLLDNGTPPLGVDELVGLFERSEIARNRPLVRALARTVLQRKEDGARSEWARKLYREVRYATGPLLLEGLSEDELYSMVQTVVRQRL